ncbi:MAG: 3-phytase [Rhodobiaceae bacterium]|nr:3-phytase [Rhodobiaceae bacterium]RPF95900.1 MAG: phytase [Rhizobiales bacterium TMED227]
MRILLIFLSIVLVSCGSQNDTVVVDYVVETNPVSSTGDAADDPAIWVNELNPQQSLIFGTDKRKGIHVYKLDGSELGFSELGATNNVDVRVLNETLYIATSNRTTSTIDLWSINESDAYEFFNKYKDPFRALNSKSYEANMNVYGICLGLYNNELIALLTEEEGVALQFWNLTDEMLLNTINLIEDEINPPSSGNEAEGCVFDDENETFFVSREGNDGILKAFSTQNQTFIKVIDNRDGNITGDPEGVAVYKISDNEGFLIVSSQGDSTFNVYDRKYPYDFKYKFSVIDVADTDGLDIVNFEFSDQFKDGLMVVQDGYNTPNNQNFKIVSVTDIKKKILIPGLSN